VASGDLQEEVSHLKQAPGGYTLAHGGAGFVQSLSTLWLIDEDQLIVLPVLLAGGLLLKEPMDLKLLSTRSFPADAVALIYGRIGDIAAFYGAPSVKSSRS